MLVHGVDDKRQITISISSIATGNLFPFHEQQTNVGQMQCEEARWHLTYSKNNWSNVQTCKDFVVKILQPYKKQ